MAHSDEPRNVIFGDEEWEVLNSENKEYHTPTSDRREVPCSVPQRVRSVLSSELSFEEATLEGLVEEPSLVEVSDAGSDCMSWSSHGEAEVEEREEELSRDMQDEVTRALTEKLPMMGPKGQKYVGGASAVESDVPPACFLGGAQLVSVDDELAMDSTLARTDTPRSDKRGDYQVDLHPSLTEAFVEECLCEVYQGQGSGLTAALTENLSDVEERRSSLAEENVRKPLVVSPVKLEVLSRADDDIDMSRMKKLSPAHCRLSSAETVAVCLRIACDGQDPPVRVDIAQFPSPQLSSPIPSRLSRGPPSPVEKVKQLVTAPINELAGFGSGSQCSSVVSSIRSVQLRGPEGKKTALVASVYKEKEKQGASRFLQWLLPGLLCLITVHHLVFADKGRTCHTFTSEDLRSSSSSVRSCCYPDVGGGTSSGSGFLSGSISSIGSSDFSTESWTA